MLFMFSLEWEKFSIANVVVEANHYLEELSNDLGLSDRVIFNCASLGAGEWITGNKKKSALPPIPSETLDYLRWHHRQVKEAIRLSTPFIANRDMTEMLKNLKGNGHELAVISATRTEKIEDALIETRTRDYFGVNVFGYDKLPSHLRGDFTLAALYKTAINSLDADIEESFVVADTPEAIQDAVPLDARAIVGYLNPYVPEKEQALRLKEMEQAGADYTTVGGNTVSVLPIFLSVIADRQALADIEHIMAKGRNIDHLMGRGLE